MKVKRGFLTAAAVIDIVVGAMCLIVGLILFIVLFVSPYDRGQEAFLSFLLWGGEGGALLAFGIRQLAMGEKRGEAFRAESGTLLGFSVTKTLFSLLGLLLSAAVYGYPSLLSLAQIVSTVFGYLAFVQAKNEPVLSVPSESHASCPPALEDKVRKLERLNALHAAGAITEEELALLKAELFGKR